MPFTPNFYHFQIHDLGKVRGWVSTGFWFLYHQSWSLPCGGLWCRANGQSWCLECGCPGPLAPIQHSVMAWVITHQPSHVVKGSVARCANLPTQVLAPVSVNMASLTLPKFRPSPRDHLHRRGQLSLGPLLPLWWGHSWHVIAYLPPLALSRHEVMEAYLLFLWLE